MGFLSFLPLMQQAGAYQYFTRPQQGQVVPNQPGALTAAYNQQPQPQPRPRSPFAAAPAVTAPELQMTAGAALPDLGQMKPPAIQPQPGFGQRFATAFGSGEGSVFNSPLFNLGLSLLGNAQGSNWGGVAQDMQGFQNNQLQRQRYQNEMRRAKVQEGRENAQYSGYEAALRAETDPGRQAMLRALGPEGYGQLMLQDQNRQFQATENAADRALREREMEENARLRRAQLGYQQSQDQWMRRFQGALGAADATSVAEQGALVRQGYTQVRPILQEMRSIIERYPDIMGSWVNTADRTQLVRLAGGDPERLAAMERFQGLATQLTLPQLEALRPATNLDFERVRATVADPQMSSRGAIAYLDSQLQSLERARQVSESQGQWISQYGSLSLPNENGQTWATAVQDQPFMQFNPRSPESIAGGAAQGQAPQRGDIVDGYRFMGGDPSNRRNWVRIQGQSRTPQQRVNNGVTR